MTELILWAVVVALLAAVVWLSACVLDLKKFVEDQESRNSDTQARAERWAEISIEHGRLLSALRDIGVIRPNPAFGLSEQHVPGSLVARIQGLELEVGRLQGLLIEAGVVAHTPEGLCVDHSAKDTDDVLGALIKKLGLQVEFHKTEEHFEVVKAPKS